MTSRRNIDPAEAAQITERIDQFFNFVRDAIDDPRIIEAIPNGSELMFRDVEHQGQSIRLTAYLSKDPGARWGARVSGSRQPAAVEVPSPSRIPTIRDRSGQWPSVAGYDTAEAALDALEAAIGTGEQSRPMTRRAVGA
jgi:hypothetical protein